MLIFSYAASATTLFGIRYDVIRHPLRRYSASATTLFGIPASATTLFGIRYDVIRLIPRLAVLCCVSEGFAAQSNRRTTRLPKTQESSGFLLRNTWQSLVMGGPCGRSQPAGSYCPVCKPTRSARIVLQQGDGLAALGNAHDSHHLR